MAVERAAAVDGIVGIGGSSDGRTGIAAAAGIVHVPRIPEVFE